MKIKIISSLEEMKEIQDYWMRLFNYGEYSIFQSFEFNYYSWKFELSKNALNRLCIVLGKNKAIDLIIPFYIDSKKRLRFINDNHADFCDYISNEIINFSKIYDYLRKELDFRFIRLINLPSESNFYKSLICLSSINCVTRSISEYSELVIQKGDFPYNVPHYRSHQKNRLNKAIRKHEDKTSLVFNYKEHSFPKKEILLLKEVMINSGIRKDDFLTNEMLCLIEHLYNSGFLILHVMMDKDRMSACNIILTGSSNAFMFWIDLFDNLQMINISSYIRFIKSTSSERNLVVNFGRGGYFYKKSNFAPRFHQLYEFFLFQNTYQRLRFFVLDSIKNLLVLIYKKIKF